MSEATPNFLCCLYCWRLSRESEWTACGNRCPSCQAKAVHRRFWRTQPSASHHLHGERRFRVVPRTCRHA